ncbi:unnamed protein product, partial [Amoebophrya sp. A120]|eukprot:GSA120T00016389001.1
MTDFREEIKATCSRLLQQGRDEKDENKLKPKLQQDDHRGPPETAGTSTDNGKCIGEDQQAPKIIHYLFPPSRHLNTGERTVLKEVAKSS